MTCGNTVITSTERYAASSCLKSRMALASADCQLIPSCIAKASRVGHSTDRGAVAMAKTATRKGSSVRSGGTVLIASLSSASSISVREQADGPHLGCGHPTRARNDQCALKAARGARSAPRQSEALRGPQTCGPAKTRRLKQISLPILPCAAPQACARDLRVACTAGGGAPTDRMSSAPLRSSGLPSPLPDDRAVQAPRRARY
jgi:hypothetical protein